MIIKDIDTATGSEIERPATPDEIAQRQIDDEYVATQDAVTAAAEASRVQAVHDAQAELKVLGLSEAAIATISGYPYPYSPAV